MERESFESLVRARFKEKGIKPPGRVWAGITGSLNDHTISSLQSSQTRYRWLAVAAVFLAIFSFAINIDFRDYVSYQDSNGASYNALLPGSSEHFRFFEFDLYEDAFDGSQNPGSNVLFLVEKQVPVKETYVVGNTRIVKQLFIELPKLNKLMPDVREVLVTEDSFNPYVVLQYNPTKQRKSKSSGTSFWAGVEAGAGSFNPDFDGSDPIGGDVDFGTLASNIGQSGFVNPTSTAVQNGMDQGVVTSFGVDFGMKVGKKWTLESGVQYTSVQNQTSAALNVVDVYTIKSSNVFSSEGDLSSPLVTSAVREADIEESLEHSINLDNNLKFTSIPVKAGYYIMDERLSLRLNAGFSANYLLSNRLSDPSGQISNSESTGYNEWSFDGLTGFELGYNIFNNFNLTLEPNYRQSITPLSNNLNNRSGFMIQTGFRYIIK